MDNLIPGTDEYYKYFNDLKMKYQKKRKVKLKR